MGLECRRQWEHKSVLLTRLTYFIVKKPIVKKSTFVTVYLQISPCTIVRTKQHYPYNGCFFQFPVYSYANVESVSLEFMFAQQMTTACYLSKHVARHYTHGCKWSCRDMWGRNTIICHLSSFTYTLVYFELGVSTISKTRVCHFLLFWLTDHICNSTIFGRGNQYTESKNELLSRCQNISARYCKKDRQFIEILIHMNLTTLNQTTKQMMLCWNGWLFFDESIEFKQKFYKNMLTLIFFHKFIVKCEHFNIKNYLYDFFVIVILLILEGVL